MDWADEQARDHMGFRLDAPEDHLSEIDAEEVRALAALLREVRQQGRDEAQAKLARVVMALRGQATRLLHDGGVCFCNLHFDECRETLGCVEANAALAAVKEE